MKAYRQYPKRSVNVNDLKPYPENPRVPISEDKRFYQDLDGSMDAFGYVVPIVWNERTGHVVSGNQRLQLIKDSGMTEVDVVVVDYDENTERAAVIALNNIGGRFKKDDLAQLLSKIDGEMRNRTGYSADELRGLLKKMKQRNKDPDAMPEPPSPVTKKGDLIILGDHRLLCGDSTDPEAVKVLMDGKKATMIFTDPPYNVNYGSTKNPKYGSSTRNIWHDGRSDAHKAAIPNDAIANDNLSADDWLEFNRKLFTIFKEHCEGDVYMWGASGPDGMIARRLLVDMGCHWSATIAWIKDSLVLSPANFHRQYEPCFYGWFGKSSFNNSMNSGNDRAGLSDVWSISRPKTSTLHPTMKPVELCEKGVNLSSKQGDVVLDLFGGSGSTLIACERTDRSCYMMELEPHYCDVIIKRWEDYTGEKAVRS